MFTNKYYRFVQIFLLICLIIGGARVFRIGFSKLKRAIKNPPREVGHEVAPLRKYLSAYRHVGFFCDLPQPKLYLCTSQHALAPVILHREAISSWSAVVMYCKSQDGLRQGYQQFQLQPVVELGDGIALATKNGTVPDRASPPLKPAGKDFPRSLLYSFIATIGTVGALLVSTILGLLVVTAFRELRKIDLWLLLSIAVPLGLGLSSFIIFTVLVLYGYPSRLAILSIHALCIMPLAAIVVPKQTIASSATSIPDNIGRCVFLLLMVIGLLNFFMMYIGRPHGGADAQFFWNVKAHLLIRDGSNWLQLFHFLVRSDYPLLLPLCVFWGDSWIGIETALASWSIAFIFTFSCIGLILGIMRQLCLPYAYWGAIVLLSTPLFMVHGSSQYADTPLAYFFLAATGLLILAQHRRWRTLIFIAGLMAGCAAWTKNEGQAFAAILLLVFLVYTCLQKKTGDFVYFVGGLLVLVPALIFFRYYIVGSQAHGEQKFLAMLNYLTWGNVRIFLEYLFLRELFHYKDWNLYLCAMLIVLFCKFRHCFSNYNNIATWTVGGMFLVYTLIIVAGTIGDVAAMMKMSFPRLLLHLWPTTVLLLLIAGQTPGRYDDSFTSVT